MPVYDIIVANPNPQNLALGWVNHPALLTRIQTIEQAHDPLNDEQVLTYLCADGYAIQAEGHLTTGSATPARREPRLQRLQALV